MDKTKRPLIILIADDDPDDCYILEEALKEVNQENIARFVSDGKELMDYLHQRDTSEPFPAPDLILLDLNMPRMDGREALKQIKSDPVLRKIPVIILTTSKEEEDVTRSYDLGINSFITKPVTFEKTTNLITILIQYWFHTVTLPPKS